MITHDVPRIRSRTAALMEARAPDPVELHREFPEHELPVLSVGTVFVADGTVAISGTVSAAMPLLAYLTINGHQVPLTGTGGFCAVVRLDGRTAIRLELETPLRTVTLDVPLKVF